MVELKNFSGENHRSPKDRNESIEWARKLLERDDWLIIDTETTGIEKSDEIIEIGIIDCKGNVVLESRLNPVKRRISKAATEIHGIQLKDLKNEPSWEEIMPQFHKIVHKKLVIAYNIFFEHKMIIQTAAKINKNPLPSKFEMQCAMTSYSAFVGDWHAAKDDYKWQKLPDAKHGAIEDCRATLKLIRKMAEAELSVLPDPWWKKLLFRIAKSSEK